MRIKLDENMPAVAVTTLRALGHDVDTAANEGLAGADDPVVLEGATRDGRLLITLDRGLGDIRAYPPGTHAGVFVIRSNHQSPRAVAREISQISTTIKLEDLSRCVSVWRDGELRVVAVTAASGAGPGRLPSRANVNPGLVGCSVI